MKRNLIFHFTWLLAVISIPAFANQPSPAEGDTLNYTNVLFEWEQQPDAACYQMQVAVNDSTGGADPFEASLVVDVIDSSLCAVVTDSLDWDQPYIWRVRPLESDGTPGDWTVAHKFFTAALPEAIPPTYATVYDSAKYHPGITAFDVTNTGYVMAVDFKGEVVWFLAMDPEVYPGFKQPDWLPNGNITAKCAGGANINIAWELTIDGEIVWEDPQIANVGLAKVVKLDNGNYLGMGRYTKNGPIPEGPWTEDFEEAGMDSVLWEADKIVEYDPDDNIVWSWDCFDHYDYADYDSVSFAKAFKKGQYGWTHCNSIHYDPVEDVIYISSKHLSRITKIDHGTGELIWNMGKTMPSGDVTFGSDLGFSQQHSIKQLENRNLMLFDNGTDNTPQVSRALEITVTESETDTTAEIVWEYVLPESLYTGGNGSAERLANGNTLMACRNENYVPEHGHLLEVDSEKNPVWMVKHEAGRMYDAERVAGLYPQAFSLIMPVFGPELAEPSIFLPVGPKTIEYELHNEGWLDETYNYKLTDSFGWFGGLGSVDVASGEHTTLSFDGTIYFDDYANKLKLVVTPEHAPALADTTILEVYSTVSSVESEGANLPKTFALHQNYPNPFNPETNIPFELDRRSKVDLRIYNLQGRLVRHLLDDVREAGRHVVTWRGDDNRGRNVPSGIYFYEMRAGNNVARKRMILLK